MIDEKTVVVTKDIPPHAEWVAPATHSADNDSSNPLFTDIL